MYASGNECDSVECGSMKYRESAQGTIKLQIFKVVHSVHF
jgi:hypothetical protein